MILNIFFDKWINMYFEMDRKILLGAWEMSLEMFEKNFFKFFILFVKNWEE